LIISRTPFRISFFGGGTDYDVWYQEHGGAVLSTAINRYCYVSCRYLPPFFDYRNRIVYSKTETVNDLDEIIHPVVREVLKMMNLQGLEVHHDGDLPSRAGLGSSSSFTVGIINALNALLEKSMSKEQLARAAYHLERKRLKENVGIQDQIATAYGGLNKVDISCDGSFNVNPVVLNNERLTSLQDSMLLVFTGTSRISSEIAGHNIRAIPNKTAELHRMRQMVDEGLDILNNSSDLGDFGKLLDESWKIKRSLYKKIAPDFVDDIYDKARAAGALGGKLLGAGGGGFMLFFVRPEERASVLTALNNLLVVPIKFDFSGSQIIFHDQSSYSKMALSGKMFEHHLDNG